MKDLTFEQALIQLKKTVDQCERPDTPLEDSIKAYEHGNELVKHLQSILKDYTAKIEKVSADGKTTEPFDS